MRKRLLSLKSVAELLDISQGTVRKLVQAGHLPPPRQVLGRIPRWTYEQVMGYLYALENGSLTTLSRPPKAPRQEQK